TRAFIQKTSALLRTDRDPTDRSAWLLDGAETQILDLEELLEAVFRALAAYAALLDPAERRHFGRDDAFVDADDAALQRLGGSPGAPRPLRARISSAARPGRMFPRAWGACPRAAP